jgi:isopenicillin N synthase-like dioxygenase
MNTLKDKGYLVVKYPKDLRDLMEITIKSWKEVCMLPEDTKRDIPYSNSADGVGYELKDGSGNMGDKKENFDISLSGREWLLENIRVVNNQVILDFVNNAVLLVDRMRQTISDFAATVERDFEIKGFKQEVDDSMDKYFIRFIHYFPGASSGDEIARAHTDQSGFTFHLYESTPGLQCLEYDGDWVDSVVSSGETIIFNAMQMQLRSAGKLRALCHRVVATEESVRNSRYSAVCFVQLANTPKYNKSKNGRLQEKTPGFNYKMSVEEFSKLFS